MVLLRRDATIFEEVTEDALEVDDDHRVVKLVRPTPEVMTVRALEKPVSLRLQLHLNVLLLHLLRLVGDSFLCLGLSILVRELALAG